MEKGKACRRKDFGWSLSESRATSRQSLCSVRGGRRSKIVGWLKVGSREMSAATQQGGRMFVPRAPIKGSFPLDHEGVCKASMLRYMICIQSNGGNNTACRLLAKEYFRCRMDNGLMQQEDWNTLGYKDLSPSSSASSAASENS